MIADAQSIKYSYLSLPGLVLNSNIYRQVFLCSIFKAFRNIACSKFFVFIQKMLCVSFSLKGFVISNIFSIAFSFSQNGIILYEHKILLVFFLFWTFYEQTYSLYLQHFVAYATVYAIYVFLLNFFPFFICVYCTWKILLSYII